MDQTAKNPPAFSIDALTTEKGLKTLAALLVGAGVAEHMTAGPRSLDLAYEMETSNNFTPPVSP